MFKVGAPNADKILVKRFDFPARFSSPFFVPLSAEIFLWDHQAHTKKLVNKKSMKSNFPKKA